MSVNDLMRLPRLRRGSRRRGRGKLTYQDYRDSLVAQMLAQRPRGWTPLKTYRVDAQLRLLRYRDRLELGYCLKAHLDAAILAGLVEDDGYHNLLDYDIEQTCVSRAEQGCTLTLTALPGKRERRRRASKRDTRGAD